MAHPGDANSYEYSDDADIILRSSDNVEFYVISALLRYVSPVFKDMFALGRSDNNEKKDNLPVVPVEEDSETVYLLLDTIYPYEEEPQLSNPLITWKVSKATQKYMMNIIEGKLKRQIANSKLIAGLPLSIYAIAIDLGWEEVAINAARRTLNTSLQELAYVDELHCITGAGFYRFLEYRHLCENSECPQEEVLPPLRCHEDSIETRASLSGSDTPHSDHIEDIPFTTASEPYTHAEESELSDPIETRTGSSASDTPNSHHDTEDIPFATASEPYAHSELPDPIETHTSSSRPDTPHSDHIEDIPFATASEPYTRSELSDLILRTPDGVDFYVVAALLRLSSPFFNRTCPLENPVTKDGLAVIDVEEDSNVLYLLLDFIYPVQEPDIQSAELYAQLVFAARRYEMTNIEDRVRKHATASSLVTAEPLRVYAVASALGWTHLAKTAALKTLRTPFHELSFVDEMHLMTGGQLFHLMRFRFVCADAACDALNTSTFKDYGFGQWSKWQGYNLNSFNAKVPGVLHEQLKACPRGSTVISAFDEGLSKGIAGAKKDGRSGAAASIFLKILQCIQDTPDAVEKAVLKVDFPSCL